MKKDPPQKIKTINSFVCESQESMKSTEWQSCFMIIMPFLGWRKSLVSVKRRENGKGGLGVGEGKIRPIKRLKKQTNKKPVLVVPLRELDILRAE